MQDQVTKVAVALNHNETNSLKGSLFPPFCLLQVYGKKKSHKKLVFLTRNF